MLKKLVLLSLSLFIVIIFFCLRICEAKVANIKLIYAPLYLTINSKSIIPNAEKIDLYIESFSDMRVNIEKNVIGEAKTGTFDKTTPILTDDGVVEISTRTLQEAFAKLGLNVVDDESSADLIFKGRINKFWVQEYLSSRSGFGQSEAEVTFDVALIDRIQEKTIWFDRKVSHIKSGDSLDTTSHNERIINEAFGKVISSIIHDEEMRIAMKEFIQKKNKF